MEALGGVASIIAVVDISIKSAVAVQALVSAIKNGPQTIALLGQDVTSLFVVLSRLAQCQLEGISQGTLKSLCSHVKSCDEELATIQTLLIELQSKSQGFTDRARAGIRVVRKGKDLDQAHQRVRDLTTQLNLYLALVQAETTKTTGQGLDHILSTLQKVQNRLEDITIHADLAKASMICDEDALRAQKLKQECEELQDTVSRLSQLVDHSGAVLSAEDAKHIVDDLQRLIQSAKDHAGVELDDSNGKQTKNELRLVESLIYAAPSVSINSSAPRLAKQPGAALQGAGVKQRRLRKDIDIGCGVLTISTKKRERIGDNRSTASSSATSGRSRREVIANFTFRPTNNAFTFSVSVTQSDLFDYCLQSLPEMCFNPTLPNKSPVFSIIKEGRIDEFRTLLTEGKTSLRAHDEHGSGLLYYAIEQPEICKLLLQAGADVDEVMTDHNGFQVTALLLAVRRHSRDTMQHLLENGADPFIRTKDNISAFHWGCIENDAMAVRSIISHEIPCLQDEINDMSDGNSAILKACSPWSDGHCSPDKILALVEAGADLQARAFERIPFFPAGSSVLHVLISQAHYPSNQDELKSLVVLIQRGCDIRAVCAEDKSVSRVAYEMNEYERLEFFEQIGGYRGDLWDAALVRCGYELLEFREEFPRLPNYDRKYQRADFERLWQGYEHLCPYWDDCRWPATGGDSDHSWRVMDSDSSLNWTEEDGACISDDENMFSTEGEALRDVEKEEREEVSEGENDARVIEELQVVEDGYEADHEALPDSNSLTSSGKVNSPSKMSDDMAPCTRRHPPRKAGHSDDAQGSIPQGIACQGAPGDLPAGLRLTDLEAPSQITEGTFACTEQELGSSDAGWWSERVRSIYSASMRWDEMDMENPWAS